MSSESESDNTHNTSDSENESENEQEQEQEQELEQEKLIKIELELNKMCEEQEIILEKISKNIHRIIGDIQKENEQNNELEIDMSKLNGSQQYLIEEFNKKKGEIMNSNENRETKNALIKSLREKLLSEITYDEERKSKIDKLTSLINLQLNEKFKEKFKESLKNQPERYIKKKTDKIKISDLLLYHRINDILDNCIKIENNNQLYKEGKELFVVVDPNNKYPELCNLIANDRKIREEKEKEKQSRINILKPLVYGIEKLCLIDPRNNDTRDKFNEYLENYKSSSDNEIKINDSELYDNLVNITTKYVRKPEDQNNILNIIKKND